MIEVYGRGYNLYHIYYVFIEAFLIQLRLAVSNKIEFCSESEYQSLKRPTFDIEMLARRYVSDFIIHNRDLINEVKGHKVELAFELLEDKIVVKTERVEKR